MQISMHLLRKLAASVALGAVLVISISIAVIPTIRPDHPGALALVLLIVGLVLGGRALWTRPPLALLAVVAACVFMLPFAVIARGFGRVDMMALLFHVEFGTEGAGAAGLETEIFQSTIALIFVVLSLYLLVSLWRLGWRMIGASALVLFALNPMTRFVAFGAVFPPPPSDLADHLAAPLIDRQPDPLPDIVILYLEGTDRRFADTRYFGDSYAPIRALEPEALTFQGVGQIVGTSWSLAGMVASLCGVPLMPRGFLARNNFDGISRFMPNLVCLTDVLADHGYRMEYVVGGDAAFAGIDAFYRTHGVETQIDLAAQSALYPSAEVEAALINWIVDDQMTFDTSRLRHDALLADPAPYTLIIETIGPHGVPGYLSRRCTADGQAVMSREQVQVVRCTTEDSLAFIRDIQEAHRVAGRDRPLKIILMSDHLSHHADIPDVAPELHLVNTVLMIGGDGAGTINDTPGSMIDVYPTLLEWLGFAAAPVAGGLGRSLLPGNAETLVMQHGIPFLDAMLVGDARLNRAMWHGSD